MPDLPKDYDFTKAEKKWRTSWEKSRIYRFDETDREREIFAVDTPPPYASADHLHQGHIMSYAQAEFIVRYQRMRGKNVFYPMGYDTNGLPTERFVEKKCGLNKYNSTREEFIAACLAETGRCEKTYEKLWKILGISVDWTRTYSTINAHCRKISQKSFLDLFRAGRIERAKKPITWCVKCETALAAADLEDEEKDTNFVHIKVHADDGSEIIFATTRPELLPSCAGMSVHPSDERYRDLVGKKFKMPITGAEIELTADECVSPEFGTGVVYFCSSGDAQYQDWASRHTVAEPIFLMEPDGKLNAHAGPYAGLKMKAAREKIIEDLQNLGAAVKIEPLRHTVKVHERCSTDVEYLNSTQWFIKVTDRKKELLARSRELKMFPEKMRVRLEAWIENLKMDWCISRQRFFGVPFPVWHCADCGEVILADEKSLPVDPTADAPPVAKCPKCASKNIIPDADVMDTWMTSSVTPQIVAGLAPTRAAELFPMDLRPQAHEIIRTWLFYTLVKADFENDSLPFKNAMISGHGIAADGRKLSKRLGNYTPPEEVIEKFGADAMRFWAAGAALGEDQRWDENEVKKGKKTVTKLWNAAKFCAGAIDENLTLANLEPADRDLLDRLHRTVETATDEFENFAFSRAKEAIDKFFWADLCDFYLEAAKYRLYAEGGPDAAVRATLTAALRAVLKLWAPFLPFVTEEIWSHLFPGAGSIHRAAWPTADEIPAATEDFRAEFETVRAAVAEIWKQKSERGLSLGAEIPALGLATRVKNFTAHRDFLEQIGRIGTLTEGILPGGKITTAARDPEAVAREKANLEKFIAGIEAKLANKNFVQNAPTAVVDAEREKLETARGKLAALV